MEPIGPPIRLVGLGDPFPGRELMLACAPRPSTSGGVGGQVDIVSVDGREPKLWAIVPVGSAELWQAVLELWERKQRFSVEGDPTAPRPVD